MITETKRKINLISHPFVKQLIMDCQTIHNTKDIVLNKEYVRRVHLKYTQIKTLFELFQNIRVMVAELHPFAEKKHSSVSKTFQLKYHVGNYFLRLTTYKDLAFQFIIETERVSIKAKNALGKKINDWAKTNNKTIILRLTSNLQTMFAHVSNIRNEIAHEGGLSDIDIQLIDASFEISKDVTGIFKENDFDLYYQAIILKNIREMVQVEEDIVTNFFEIMDELRESYERNKLTN